MPDDNAMLDQIEDAVDKIGSDIRGDLQERLSNQRAKKPRDKQGRDSRVHTRAYTAMLEGVETFEWLLGTLAHRCGHHAAKEGVVLGDSAPWLWFMFGRLFPGALPIPDFYPACEHLATVADAM